MSEEDFDNRMKLYILVRKDILTDQQIAVQSVHALQEYNSQYGECPNLKDWASNHKTVVILAANERELDQYSDNFEGNCAGFCESDLDNMLTAVAFEPITHAKGKKVFSRLKLV